MTTHSHDLERSVLAVLMDGRHANLLDVFFDIIPHPLVFHERNHQLLYFAVTKTARDGMPMGAPSVAQACSTIPLVDALEWLSNYSKWARSDQWHQFGQADFQGFRKLYHWEAMESESILDAVGGFQYLADLGGAYVTASGFEKQCEQLATYWELRFTKMQLSAMLERMDKPDALDHLVAERTRLTEIGGYTTTHSDHAESLGEIVTQIVETDAIEHDEGSWGDSRMDECLPLRRNSLVLLAARPACGKTSRAVQLARATAAQSGFAPGRVAIASLEIDQQQFGTWVAAQEIGVSYQTVDNRLWTPAQRKQAAEAAKAWGQSIAVNDGMVTTAEKITTWARKHARRYPDFHMLIVDHMHIMDGPGEEYSRLTHISRKLKLLSKELNICVIALAQLNRGNEHTGKPPTLAALRGSGSLEQDASAVVFLHCNDKEGRERASSMIVAKNRYGPTKTVNCVFRAGYGGEYVAPVAAHNSVDPYGISDKYKTKPSPDEDLFG